MEDRLIEIYYEVAADGTTLPEFFDAVLAGTYGQWDRVVIIHCLDQIERIVLSNILTMQESRARSIGSAEDALAEAEQEFNQVRTKVLNS